MFQTVRHWWGSGRGKVTARLFLFELGVVVIGVLIAQALSAYFQQRADFARMESERSRIRYELTSAHSAFQTWRAAVPCLDQRMTEIMSGKDFAPNAMRRPSLLSPDYAPPTTEVLDLVAKRYGVQEKISLTWIATNIAQVTEADFAIRDKWGRLMLIDPANGPVTVADHAEARLAAADIKAQLRRINGLTADVEPIFRKLGIAARDQYQPDHGPARSCAAIWRSGEINPPLTMR
jgi:hypothetical protein